MTSNSSQHLLFLDLVRGLSAMLVVMGHATVLAFPSLMGRPNFFYVQSWAVVVFLALSGYLIVRSVIRRIDNGTFTLIGYVKDRGARILTPLIPLVPVVVLGDRMFLGNPPTTPYVQNVDVGLGSIVSNIFMLQENWAVQVIDRLLGTDLSHRSLGSAAPWWTVALEWWIYIAFGCLLALVAGLTQHKVVVAVVGLFAVTTVLGSILSGNPLVLAWVVGGLFAWLDPTLSKTAWTVIAVLSVVGIIGILYVKQGAVYSIPVVALTPVAIFAAFRAAKWGVLARVRRPITFIADYSYSLYLIHFSVLVWMAALTPEFRGVGFIVLGSVVSNTVAIAWWFLFERHHRKVRIRLDQRTPFRLSRRTP